MFQFDLRTIFLNFILTELISFVFIVILWLQNRKRIDGIQFIVWHFLFQLVSICLIYLREFIPDFFSMVVSNGLGMASILFLLTGFRRITGKKQKQSILNILYIAIFVLVHMYFTYIKPVQEYRNMNVAIGYFILGSQCVWLLLFDTQRKYRSLTLNTGIIYLIFTALNLTRIVWYLAFDETEDSYFKAVGFEVFVAFSYQIIYLIITYFVVLMINQRLVNDITAEEKKLSIAFHAVPYAILITRFKDGQIIDVNAGFEQITQYKKEEVIGKSTKDMKLWADSRERDVLLQELQTNGIATEMEFQFRKKSEEIFTGQISSILVEVEYEECLLLVINDITLRMKAESEIKKSRDILKNLVFNLQSKHEQEKINLAAQIDNQLNQSLTALRLNLGILKKELTSNPAVVSGDLLELADKTYTQIGSTIQHSLSLMGQLRNEVLFLLGLEEAIIYFLEEIELKNGVVCEFNTGNSEIQLSKNTSAIFFNIFQEIINKIIEKKKATRIETTLEINKTNLQLTITENGNSYSANTNNGSFDQPEIQILREKILLLNGILSVFVVRNNNNRLLIEIPVSPNPNVLQ